MCNYWVIQQKLRKHYMSIVIENLKKLFKVKKRKINKKYIPYDPAFRHLRMSHQTKTKLKLASKGGSCTLVSTAALLITGEM